MSHTVVGIFNNLHEAQKAFDHLLDSDFNRNQVDLSEDYSNSYGTYNDTDRKRHDDSISSFFDTLFGDNDHKDDYKTAVRNGSMVTVHADSRERAEKAQSILDRYGAIDMDGDSSEYRSGETTEHTVDSDTNKTNPVIEEDLQVGKREVEGGGVRVRSRIVERPVEESLRLRTEHVHVERNPVDRKATDAELEKFEDKTIEMTERSEEAVVNKEARVTEEINVHKDVEERKETVKEEIRETEVDVDETTAKRTDKDHSTIDDDQDDLHRKDRTL